MFGKELKLPSWTDTGISFSNFCNMIATLKKLQNLSFDQNFSVVDSGGCIQVSLIPGANSDEERPYGWRLGNSKVTIIKGELQHGAKAPLMTPDTDIALPVTTTTTVYYIGWQYNGSVLALSASTNKTDFQSTEDSFRSWILAVNVTGTSVKLKEKGYVAGNILVPSLFAF